jgi:hypothetical protein
MLLLRALYLRLSQNAELHRETGLHDILFQIYLAVCTNRDLARHIPIESHDHGNARLPSFHTANALAVPGRPPGALSILVAFWILTYVQQRGSKTYRFRLHDSFGPYIRISISGGITYNSSFEANRS